MRFFFLSCDQDKNESHVYYIILVKKKLVMEYKKLFLKKSSTSIAFNTMWYITNLFEKCLDFFSVKIYRMAVFDKANMS